MLAEESQYLGYKGDGNNGQPAKDQIPAQLFFLDIHI